jgi:hypothetical protein
MKRGGLKVGSLVCWGLVLAWSATAFCGSVRLYNDSPYVLRAVVRSNNGSYLGEMVINPGDISTWDDNQFGQGNYAQQQNVSQTPYTVLWYCLDGTDYSVCYQVASASTVSAQSCNGNRQCKSAQNMPPSCPPQPPPGGSFLQPCPPCPPCAPEASESAPSSGNG